MGKEENKVQQRVHDILNSYAVDFYRHNQLPVPGRRFIGMKGVPDTIAILPPNGRYWGIESKTKSGKQFDDQKKFQALLQANGGLYTLAQDNMDEVIRICQGVRELKLKTNSGIYGCRGRGKMDINLKLSIGYPGACVEDSMDIESLTGFTEEEFKELEQEKKDKVLEKATEEWAFNYIEYSYEIGE